MWSDYFSQYYQQKCYISSTLGNVMRNTRNSLFYFFINLMSLSFNSGSLETLNSNSLFTRRKYDIFFIPKFFKYFSSSVEIDDADKCVLFPTWFKSIIEVKEFDKNWPQKQEKIDSYNPTLEAIIHCNYIIFIFILFQLLNT